MRRVYRSSQSFPQYHNKPKTEARDEAFSLLTMMATEVCCHAYTQSYWIQCPDGGKVIQGISRTGGLTGETDHRGLDRGLELRDEQSSQWDRVEKWTPEHSKLPLPWAEVWSLGGSGEQCWWDTGKQRAAEHQIADTIGSAPGREPGSHSGSWSWGLDHEGKGLFSFLCLLELHCITIGKSTH